MGQLPRILQALPMLDPVGDELMEGRANLVTASALDAATLVREGQDAVAIIARTPAKIGAEVFDALPSVRVVSATGSGADCFDVVAASERGIPVLHNPGVAPVPVAEHVIAATLVLLKRIHEYDRRLRAGLWRPPSDYYGEQAAGHTLGLVGFGNIGRAVAVRAAGLSMRVIAHDGYVDDGEFAAFGVTRTATLDELLAESDVVSLHVPLSPATRHLISAPQLAAMRPRALLINTSRGPVVDEDALVEALRAGVIGGAAVDVYASEPPPPDHPLFTFENVLATPHTAGVTVEAMRDLTAATVNNLLGAVDGARPPHLVDSSVWPPRRTPKGAETLAR